MAALFTVHAFSNKPEYTPTRGGVYIITDLTETQVEDLKAREAQENPDRWLRVEEQS
ncbi:hypothetical protein ACWDG9_04935 [Streptomyces sp. NPDC001073]